MQTLSQILSNIRKNQLKLKLCSKKQCLILKKAHQLKPDDRECMIALRGIYYNLNMGDKFDAIEAEMNK